jgi:Arc/MetJ-type ribon-helix-helix transcriptional regulator
MSSKDEGVRPSVSLSPQLNGEIEGRLDYGDSKSSFIRDAIQFKLDVEDVVEDVVPDGVSTEEWVLEAVRERRDTEQ